MLYSIITAASQDTTLGDPTYGMQTWFSMGGVTLALVLASTALPLRAFPALLFIYFPLISFHIAHTKKTQW